MSCDPHEELIEVAHRFLWMDNDTIRIINSEGVERLIDLRNNFREIEFNKISMYVPEWAKQGHYYINPPASESPEDLKAGIVFDTLRRLRRKYQHFKSSYFLEKKRDSNSLYNILNTVDYKYKFSRDKYVADLSFSFLHWNLMEQLEKGEITPDQIDDEQVQRLIYNILPGGNTFLHKLADKGDVLEAIFKVCHPNVENRAEVMFEVPFLKNFLHQSPMDILNGKKDYRTMNMMLEYLSGYGIDHHSRAMVSVFPEMISH